MTDQDANRQKKLMAIAAEPTTMQRLPQSPLELSPAKLRRHLADRLSALEAASSVVTMLRSYPETGKPDSAEYKDALARALMQYPAEIAIRCGSVDSGVITETMFKPTCADIHNWCKRESKWLYDLQAKYDREGSERNDAKKMKSLEQIEVERLNRENIHELRNRLGPRFGLRGLIDPKVVTHDAGDASIEPDPRREAALARMDAANAKHYEAYTLAEYERRGLEVQRNPDGTLVPLYPAFKEK